MKIPIFLSSALASEILNNFLVETILRVGWTHFGFPVSFPFVPRLFLPSSQAVYQIFPLQKIIRHTLWYLNVPKTTNYVIALGYFLFNVQNGNNLIWGVGGRDQLFLGIFLNNYPRNLFYSNQLCLWIVFIL